MDIETLAAAIGWMRNQPDNAASSAAAAAKSAQDAQDAADTVESATVAETKAHLGIA